MTAETSNARGLVEYEYEVWQGAAWQAGGSTTDYAAAKAEADHYAMMYGQDGPVEVRLYEKRLLNATPPPPADAFSFAGQVYSRIEIPAGCSLSVDGNVLRVALSQQPEARGVVDEAMVERAREAYFNAAEVKDGVFTDPVAMRAALTAALTEARNG